MSEAYLVWNDGQLDGAQWQGLRFLEIDLTAPGFAAVVTARLARPANGMTPDSVEVVGGRSITDLAYEADVTNGSSTLTVRFHDRGDHSDYYIRLRDGGNDPLHPFFCQAPFNFYIDCPLGDCRPSVTLPTPNPGRSPSVDLRNKDFKGFMRVLSEWVKAHNPHWADLSPASFERVCLELLCHHADMLSYYQDRVANEAFISTATQRHSLRQHATLLGYRLFDGQAGKTVLAFEVTNAGFVPAGLSVQMNRISGDAPVVYYPTKRTAVDPRNNASQLIPAAWPGADSATIPRGATGLLLWDQSHALTPGQRICFTQGSFSQILTLTQVTPVDLPGWVADPTDPPHTNDTPLTRLAWQPSLQETLRPWDTHTPMRIHGNLVDASHGQQKTAWLGQTATPAREDVAISLNPGNSVVVSFKRGSDLIPQLRALQVPEGPVVFETDSDGNTAPVLEVLVSDQRWSREPFLHNSKSYDTHYVAQADEDGRLWLQFGDGVHGRDVPINPLNTQQTLDDIRIEYRVGAPLDGNCARDTLTEIIRPAPQEFVNLEPAEVTNVVAGVGGREPDSLDAVRLRIPASLRHGPMERAVALSDYAAAAQTVPGVVRATVRALDGVFNTILVLVDPEGQTRLTDSLKQAVWDRIEHLRMAGREHFIAPPVYVPLQVRLVVCVEPGFLHHQVRDRVLTELRPGTSDRPGYFHPDRLSFGQQIEAGDLLAFVQGIAGVRSVKLMDFRRLDADTPPAVVDQINLSSTEVARLDADEDFPENGQLKVAAVGLDVVDESAFAMAGPPAEPTHPEAGGVS